MVLATAITSPSRFFSCVFAAGPILSLRFDYSVPGPYWYEPKGGESALHIAVTGSEASAEIVRYLIRKGADVNEVETNGLSPLALAIDGPRKQDLVASLVGTSYFPRP